jgi:hypothetical protein
MNFVARKGCWLTAFNYCKLLYSLDPIRDPLGAMLSIDLFAIKAGETKWLIEFYNQFKGERQLEVFVNWRYALYVF